MLKIVKKNELTRSKEITLRVGAVLAALLASAIIIAFMGYNPITIFWNIIKGSTGTLYRFKETINKSIPLVVLSLGIAISFKMKFWNIGAEGQFYMGAFAASFVAFNYSTLPAIILIPLMMLAGFVGGGICALIPAFLKIKFEASETLVTLMLNYIVARWIQYLQYGPWKDPKAGGFPKMPRFVDEAILPKVFGVHIGWIIALVLAVLVYILFRKTKLGYEIAVVGENDTTARYAGMNVSKILIVSVLLSGGLCGLTGMMQASAIENSLSEQLSGGLGFTAIITTWLARLSPPVIVVVSFFFAILLQGGSYLQSSMQIPASVADILQGVILFFVLGSEFFTRYRLVTAKKLAAEVAASKREVNDNE